MSEQEVKRIKFEYLLTWIVIGHCQREQAKIRIRGALYGLQRQGLVRRVGRDLWISVKPEQNKPNQSK